MKKKNILNVIVFTSPLFLSTSPPPPPQFNAPTAPAPMPSGQPSEPNSFTPPSISGPSFSPPSSGPQGATPPPVSSSAPSFNASATPAPMPSGQPSESNSFAPPVNPGGATDSFQSAGAPQTNEPRPVGFTPPSLGGNRFGDAQSRRPEELGKQQGLRKFSKSRVGNTVPSFGSSLHDKRASSMQTANHDVQKIDEDLAKENDLIIKELDTFDIEGSGNWLIKRAWWGETESVYSEIKTEYTNVLDMRVQFIDMHNKLDRELDIFYGEMGLEQGQMQAVLSYGLDLMNKQRKQMGILTKRELEVVDRLQAKEEELGQFKNDVKAMQGVEDKLDQALGTLFKQIDVCSQYEQKAWMNLREIARELDDKQARKLYYQTQGLLDDIKKIKGYINGSFFSYFSNTIDSARSNAKKITAHMQSLKNAGIDLKKEAELLEYTDEQIEAKKEEEKAKIDVQAGEKKKVAVKQESFFAGILSSVATVFYSVIDYITSFFVSKPTVTVKAKTKTVATSSAKNEKKKLTIL